MFRCALAAALLAVAAWVAPPLGAATVYRSVDEQGRVSYSDRPAPGAEAVDVRSPNIGQRYDAPHRERSGPEEDEVFAGYDELRISEPTTAIPNGLVPTAVVVRIDPQLQPGHRLELLLDGDYYGHTRGDRFTIEQMSRGPHTLQVRVVDEAGSPLRHSESVEVYVHWPRVNRPGTGN